MSASRPEPTCGTGIKRQSSSTRGLAPVATEPCRRGWKQEMGSRPGPCPLPASLQGRLQEPGKGLVLGVPALGSSVSIRKTSDTH
jgi:hypothetical protein